MRVGILNFLPSAVTTPFSSVLITRMKGLGSSWANTMLGTDDNLIIQQKKTIIPFLKIVYTFTPGLDLRI